MSDSTSSDYSLAVTATIADLSLGSVEVDYFVELRGTLEGMSDTDRLGDVFDSVQCRLR